MTRKKLFLIVVVTGLSLLNIYLARFASQDADVSMETTTSLATKKPKVPNIIVLHVDDIHPITHLQEAEKLRQATSELNTVPSNDENLPNRQVLNQVALTSTNHEPSPQVVRRTGVNSILDKDPPLIDHSFKASEDGLLHHQGRQQFSTNMGRNASANIPRNIFQTSSQNKKIYSIDAFSRSKNYADIKETQTVKDAPHKTSNWVNVGGLHGDILPKDISRKGILDSIGAHPQNDHNLHHQGINSRQEWVSAQLDPNRQTPLRKKFEYLEKLLRTQTQQGQMENRIDNILRNFTTTVQGDSKSILEEMHRNIVNDNFVQSGSVDEKLLIDLFHKVKSENLPGIYGISPEL